MSISVIIPIYNSVNTIEKCLNSVFLQTYKDYELILIDDGSYDGSGELILHLIEGKTNVHFIQQKNQGVSSARNVGIENAHGDYITFIDSDDHVDSVFLDKLIGFTSGGEKDLVFTGLSFVQTTGIVKCVPVDDCNWILDNEESLFGFVQQKLITSVCAKLYKRDIIYKNRLLFDSSICYAEDRDFNVEFLKHVKTAVTSSYCGYYYQTDTQNSLSKGKYGYKWYNDYCYWNKLFQILNASNTQNLHIHNYLSNRLFNFLTDNSAEIAEWTTWRQYYLLSEEANKTLDISYLYKHIHQIVAPIWQKKILQISRKAFSTCIFFIIKFQLHK